VKLLFHKN